MIKNFMQFLEKNNLFKGYFNKQKIERYINCVRIGDEITGSSYLNNKVKVRGKVLRLKFEDESVIGMVIHVSRVYLPRESVNSYNFNNLNHVSKQCQANDSEHLVMKKEIIDITNTEQRIMNSIDDIASI